MVACKRGYTLAYVVYRVTCTVYRVPGYVYRVTCTEMQYTNRLHEAWVVQPEVVQLEVARVASDTTGGCGLTFIQTSYKRSWNPA